MVVLKVYNKDDVLAATLHLKEDDLVNKRFQRKNSVLDILLNNNVEIYYGCMGGSCSACVCDLISGEEHIDREGIHEQVYQGIEPTEFLTCIATVKEDASDEAFIEIRTKF